MTRKLIIKGYNDGVFITVFPIVRFFRKHCGLGLKDAKNLADRFAEEGRLVLELEEPVPAWVAELDAAGLAHTLEAPARPID